MRHSFKLIVALALGISANAQATIWDFGQIADDMGEQAGTPGFMFTSGVASVSVIAENGIAYLDESLANRQAGLGVCQVIKLDGHCGPSDDDNLDSSVGGGGGETLVLEFSDTVTGFSFRDTDHFVFDPSIRYSINGLAYITAVASSIDWIGLSTSKVWIQSDQDPIYVNTATTVPLPAALWLLGSALIGLFGVRARRQS